MLGTAPQAEQVPPFWPQLRNHDLNLFNKPHSKHVVGMFGVKSGISRRPGQQFLGYQLAGKTIEGVEGAEADTKSKITVHR